MGQVAATAGTFLVLAAGRGGFAHRALSKRPLTHVGRISDSLHLWHWPLIVLADDLGICWDGPTDKVALLALTFLLAEGSYRWVEGPTRRPCSRPGPSLLAAVVPAAGALVMASHLRLQGASAYEEVQFLSYSPNPAGHPRPPRASWGRPGPIGATGPTHWPTAGSSSATNGETPGWP